MSHAKGLKLGLMAAIVLGGAIAACSAGDSLDASFGGNTDKTGNGGSPDGGAFGSTTAVPGPQNDTGLGPTDNAIILVHAAGTNAFRLCFDNHLDQKPTPSADLMPQANVVGVEVGSAIRLDPMTKPGAVYFIPEALVRGNDTITCDLVINTGGDGSSQIGVINDDWSTGVHLLVVTGCQNQPLNETLYDTARCGAGYTGKSNLAISTFDLKGKTRGDGTLPFDIAQLSQGLDTLHTQSPTKADLDITFGDLDTNKTLASSSNSPFQEVVPFGSPNIETDGGLAQFGQLGFTVSLGSEVLFKQSLADIQALSSPKDVPPTYYAAASNYVLLLLGSPAADLDAGDTDVRDKLHFLAVPVVDPKPADAGVDADDAGDGGH